MSAQDEQTHFQRLDELKLTHEHEERVAQIEANAEVEKAKLSLKQQRLNRWQQWDYDLRVILGIALVVIGIAGVVFMIWAMWAHSPQKTPDEMKQDRASACVLNNGDHDGKFDQTWWPNAAGGQGLCLPKGQMPPEEK